MRIFVHQTKTQSIMTIDEFLTQNKPILKVMMMEGISLDMGRCAGMVQFYATAKAEHGGKYAVELCKKHYSFRSKATVYRMLRILKRELP